MPGWAERGRRIRGEGVGPIAGSEAAAVLAPLAGNSDEGGSLLDNPAAAAADHIRWGVGRMEAGHHTGQGVGAARTGHLGGVVAHKRHSGEGAAAHKRYSEEGVAVRRGHSVEGAAVHRGHCGEEAAVRMAHSGGDTAGIGPVGPVGRAGEAGTGRAAGHHQAGRQEERLQGPADNRSTAAGTALGPVPDWELREAGIDMARPGSASFGDIRPEDHPEAGPLEAGHRSPVGAAGRSRVVASSWCCAIEVNGVKTQNWDTQRRRYEQFGS
jgi:hypothetical protein